MKSSVQDYNTCMQQISFDMNKYKPTPKKGRRSERGDLLDYFTQEINKERIGTKFKPVQVRYVALKVSHLRLFDLYYLRSICDDSKKRTGKFSVCFFGSLKPLIHT